MGTTMEKIVVTAGPIAAAKAPAIVAFLAANPVVIPVLAGGAAVYGVVKLLNSDSSKN